MTSPHPALQEIEQRREAAGISLKELERRAGLGVGTLVKLRKGANASPSLNVLEGCAAALGCTVGDLLGEAAQGRSATLSQLWPSPINPRKSYDEEALAALAQSIHEEGLLQNLVVRPSKEGDPCYAEPGGPHFIIQAGERRWRAMNRLKAEGKWPEDRPIDVNIRENVDDELGRVLALIENLQREDLTPIEEGEAFRTLQGHGWSSDKIAKKIHKTQRYVQLRLKLLELIPEARAAIGDGSVTLSQARALARANPSEQPALLKRILAGELADEHKIDDAAKEIARQHAGSGSGTGSAGDGRVRLNNPNAGSGGSDGEDPAPADSAEATAQSSEEAQKATSSPVPPVFEIDEDICRLPTALLYALGEQIEALLPQESKDGAWLRVGHPDLLPEEVHVQACGGSREASAAWTLWAYVAEDGISYTLAQIPQSKCEDFVRRAVDKGLQVLPKPALVTDPAEAPLPPGSSPGQATGAKPVPAEPSPEEIELARKLALVRELRVEALEPFDCRMIAGDALRVVRAHLTLDTTDDEETWAEANEEHATAFSDLVERIERLAQRSAPVPVEGAEPTAEPERKPLSDALSGGVLAEEDKLDIPDYLRRS